MLWQGRAPNLTGWVEQPGEAVAVTAERFGMNYFTNADIAFPPPDYELAPAGTVRLFYAPAGKGFTWNDMEPTRGAYDFTNLTDAAAALPEDSEIILTAGGWSPLWATGTASHAGAPTDLQDWRNYCTALATCIRDDCLGKVTIVGSFNEPDNVTFNIASKQSIAERHAILWQVFKSICPSVQIMTPESSQKSGANYLGDLLAMGVADQSDVIGFHAYYRIINVHQNAEKITELVNYLKGAIAGYPQLAGKPIINAEGSYGSDAGFTGDNHRAGYAATVFPILFWNGIARSCWFIFNAGTGVLTPWGMLWNTATEDFTPAGVSFQQIVPWLTGATITGYQVRGRQRRIQLTRAGGYQAELVWNTDADGSYVPEIAATRYRDTAGNTITLALGQSVLLTRYLPLLFETGAP